MTKPPRVCGAKRLDGEACQNRVAVAGDRCHIHRDKKKPLSSKRILPLCYKTIERIAAFGGAYALFEKVHPDIMEIVNQLSGMLMPEHFWYLGFEPKDREEMVRQIQKAHKKRDRIVERYESYSKSDKLAVEQAYQAILRVVESAQQT
jgi:hypothetical protein